ncbi:hypothetical protein JOD54_004432 [Actinokineospora baliensis]|uniref:tachylectin-related carbohydrate-binding protein n=1 Tax=Actinokineospora baliensis TaxID=547056 RepID=UPI0019589DBE|nr:tachylectin-related carbohydrate-binding protein [Actinokineospora baliensis]MBM7774228.1 hypothetical protein [Actinokineospora baliensis]
MLPDGSLFEQRHMGGSTGTHVWGARNYIGEGWQGTVRAGGHGTFFFVPLGTGELRRYHWNTEIEQWSTFDGAQYEVIGYGFDRYFGPGKTLTVVGDGSLYGVDDSGELRFWNRVGDEWDDDHGEVIGTGWDVFDEVVAGGDGFFYAFDVGGNAYLYRYSSAARTWTTQGQHIDEGWGDFLDITSAGAGVLYATAEDGSLNWYRYDNGWANNGLPRHVGEGWEITSMLTSPESCS